MIQLPDDLKTAINNAFTDGYVITWTSVGADQQPSSNFFGTSQAFSDHELAIWMRTPERGFLQRIAENPKVTMMYRNPTTRLAFQIHGEARRVDDESVKRRVYDSAAEAEQKADPERKGTAVIVDVVRVIQRGQVVLSREANEVGATA